jgi:hypothetical protein
VRTAHGSANTSSPRKRGSMDVALELAYVSDTATHKNQESLDPCVRWDDEQKQMQLLKPPRSTPPPPHD